MGTSVSSDTSHYQLLQWPNQIKDPHGSYFASLVKGRISKQLSEEINKVREFITKRGKLYRSPRLTPLHNITSGLVLPFKRAFKTTGKLL